MRYKNIEIMESLTWLMHEADSRTTARGLGYYEQNRISKLKEKDGVYFAKVRGTHTYNVEIDYDGEEAECDCPAYFPCKHIIAVVFYLSAIEQNKGADKEIMYQLPRQKTLKNRSVNPPFLELVKKVNRVPREFIFQAVDDYRFAARKYNSENKTISKIEVMDQLVLTDGTRLDYHYLFRFVHSVYQNIYFHDVVHDRYFERVRFFTSDGLPMKFKGFLPIFQRLLIEKPLKVETTSGESTDFENNFEETKYLVENFYHDPVTKKEILFITPKDFHYISRERLNKIHIETGKSPENINFYVTGFDDAAFEVYQSFWGGKRSLTDIGVLELKDAMIMAKVENLKELAPDEFGKGPVFSLSIYPDEKGRFKVKCRPEFIYSIDEKYFDTTLLAQTISDDSASKFLCRFPARLLKTTMPFKYQKSLEGNIARRDILLEKKLFKKFEQSSIPFHKKEFILKPGEISNFIEKEVPALQEAGAKIHIHKNLVRLMTDKNGNKTTFKINQKSHEINWFDGHLSIEGMGLKELRLALKAYKKKEDYFLLNDGSWVSLEAIGIKKLAQSFENLGIHISADGEVNRVNRGQMLAIEFEMDMRTDKAIENLAKRIRELPETRKKPPAKFETGFNGTLRDYQRDGVLFLESLYEIGIGGILADDMGLGKTIQGLTFIDRLTAKKSSLLTLIVGPLASVSIWKKEAEKYFPHLDIMVWHGAERKKAGFPKQGIVITTYGTLSRDFADWKENHHFDLAILDEAQNLKNFRTLSSHAVRQTNTELYFCLTGTPLENSVNDLWSLFDICFPGYLGTLKGFQNSYAYPHPELQLALRRKIEPFVMRRTKDEVLKELPPLTETLVPVTMTPKQKTFYEEARKKALIELANAENNYLMVMLPHLMKLRRIACHPEAGNPETTDPLLSGKFQHLNDILNELEASSSAVLIFSQFTDILKICGRLLKNLGHDFHYLDGSTPLKKRDKIVTSFQSGEKSFFLISLKAGGTALTLHRADTVIHLDPWWNPAVERQASDRAHRIGQKQKVFVYKLYSENSIEEKVLELQAIKKELFDNIFGEGMKNSGNITREQIKKLLEE
jgi:SNF2 family DNA or RNA helicase